MIGSQFGRVKVLALTGRSASGHVLADIECACGKRKTIRAADVRAGRIQSCGCLRDELNRTQPKAKGKTWRWKRSAAGIEAFAGRAVAAWRADSSNPERTAARIVSDWQAWL